MVEAAAAAAEAPTASRFCTQCGVVIDEPRGVAGAEFTDTQGNNVDAHSDLDGNNVPDPGSRPDGGAGLDFNFPVDLAMEPGTYIPGAVTNLFYWNNVIHDVMHH